MQKNRENNSSVSGFFSKAARSYIYRLLPQSDPDEKKTLNDLYRKHILKEFLVEPPAADNPIPIYYGLLKERALFISFQQYLRIEVDNKPNLILFEWADCILSYSSFDSFQSAVNRYLEKMDAQSDENRKIKEKNEKNFHEHYQILLTEPYRLNDEDLLNSLITLSSLNAVHTLKMIFTAHPYLKVDRSLLLREALSCLHIETVDMLIQLGANIHQNMVHSNYSDFGLQWLCSPLLFTLRLPAEPYCPIARIFPGELNWDNEKLLKILRFLISQGADPHQNSRYADIYDSVEDKNMEGPNCIEMAKEFLEMPEFQNLNPEYLDFLRELEALDQINYPSNR